jgi:uncharacterized membrane protein YesL
VGSDRSTTWLGSWAGLGLFGLLPAVAGVIVLLATARQRPTGAEARQAIR